MRMNRMSRVNEVEVFGVGRFILAGTFIVPPGNVRRLANYSS